MLDREGEIHMSLGIADVREWQTVLDLKTGRKTDRTHPELNRLRQVLARHPYPGDLNAEGNRWVTDTALDLLKQHESEFVFLAYAQHYFCSRFVVLSQEEKAGLYAGVFREIERFKRESGFQALVIGTGDLQPMKKGINLSRGFDGLGILSNWATHYAGMYGPSESDMEKLRHMEELERIVSRDEFLRDFGGTEADARKLPDYLLVARDGYCFQSSEKRKPVMIPAANVRIPFHADWAAKAQNIIDIREAVLQELRAGRKTALIVVEGIGCEGFPKPYNTCRNGVNWFTYELGETQYLAMSTGYHPIFTYPSGYRYYMEQGTGQPYPFSGYFKEMPQDTIGRAFGGPSAAVGNRSMYMHTTTGAEVSIECFARNLNNQGCLGVIREEN